MDEFGGYIPVLNLNNNIIEVDEEYVNKKKERLEKLNFKLKILSREIVKIKYLDGSIHQIICWRKYIQN